MNFVLDTNAVSETVKPHPNPGLIAWHDAQDPANLFITTVTLAEVWNGFHRNRVNTPKRFITLRPFTTWSWIVCRRSSHSTYNG